MKKNCKHTLTILGYLSVPPMVLMVLFAVMDGTLAITILLPLFLMVHSLVWLPAIKAFEISPVLGWIIWPLFSPLMGSTLLSLPFLLGGLDVVAWIWPVFTTYAYLLWFVNLPISLSCCWIIHHHTRRARFTRETPMTTPCDFLRRTT